MNRSTPTFATQIPGWQVAVVFVGFPVIYAINSFLPWSIGLFTYHDRTWYLPYFGSLALLHWTSALLVFCFLKRASSQVDAIGLSLSAQKLATMFGIPLAAGAMLILYRGLWSGHDEPILARQVILPTTLGERIIWVLIGMTAGFCEEVVYRGFAIRVLQGREMPTWLAVLMATLAYVFVHDLSGFLLFPIFFVVGLAFAGLFLWWRSLAPGICLHALLNIMQLLVP